MGLTWALLNAFKEKFPGRRYRNIAFLLVSSWSIVTTIARAFLNSFCALYIGKNPTPLANSFYILRFDFSGISTNNMEETERDFVDRVRNGIKGFNITYPQVLPANTFERLMTRNTAHMLIQDFLIECLNSSTKIYLLIDEYVHFANDLLATSLNSFKAATSSAGFVRCFFEIIKEATSRSTVSRIFITGVSSITLDSLTSGFNIGTNATLSAH